MPKKQKLIDVILESAQLVATGPDAEKYGLDLSEASIKRLDRMIKDYWGESGPSKEGRDNVIWVFGSYIAAIVDKNFWGSWEESEELGGIAFKAKTGNVRFSPYNWVAKRFDSGDELAYKYKVMKNLMRGDRKA